jgi:transposase-like protein
MELVSASEAARRLGVHPSQITRGIQSGLIPNHAPPGLGRPMVDVSEARAARERGLDRSKQRGAAAPLFAPPDDDEARDPSYQMSRARRESAAAAKAEIELAQLRGKTLDRAEVVDVAFRLGQMLREGMETRRVALVQRLIGLDVAAMISVLADADEMHLAALADAIVRDLAPDEARAAA